MQAAKAARELENPFAQEVYYRRDARAACGAGWCKSALRGELINGATDLIQAKVKPIDVKCATIFNYGMLIKLDLKDEIDFDAIVIEGDMSYNSDTRFRSNCYARQRSPW
ncbi:hypothetical protein GCM10008959_05440 [Deinococcus seoulensis]|uniref:Uncharacterized protein n=1 Tax=Deinococcus seoulensis TaxID=1837379 RepID=A0ABQ2RLM3_9DEIO|nr:hypothetical protein GCM10008959_05440 [Deinococcus seoulensis]